MSSIEWISFHRLILAERRFVNGRSQRGETSSNRLFLGWRHWPIWMPQKRSQRIKLGNFKWILKYVTMISTEFSRRTDGSRRALSLNIFFLSRLFFIINVPWEAFFFFDHAILGDTEWHVIVLTKQNTCLYLIRLLNYKHALPMIGAIARLALVLVVAHFFGQGRVLRMWIDSRSYK